MMPIAVMAPIGNHTNAARITMHHPIAQMTPANVKFIQSRLNVHAKRRTVSSSSTRKSPRETSHFESAGRDPILRPAKYAEVPATKMKTGAQK